jgi:4-amino-4-deoxy-L-arabinose transferase-like glycosyltransferase
MNPAAVAPVAVPELVADQSEGTWKTAAPDQSIDLTLPRWRQWSHLPFELGALAGIVVLGGFLRLWDLGNTPPPAADEVLAAVDLHSVSTTGRHFSGASAGLLAYLIPIFDGRDFISLFGTSVTYLRLVSAMFGILTVVVVFLLGKELFGSFVGLCAALVLAVLPWSIYISRMFFPAVEVTFLTTLTLYLLLIALRRRSAGVAIGAAAAAVISMYIYPVALILTPLFVLSIVIAKFPLLRTFGVWRATLTLAVSGLLFLPYVVQHLAPTDSAVQLANQVTATKMAWNKGMDPLHLLTYVGHNWLSYFSPSFLILHGDPNVRSSTQSIGQIGWLTGIVGILGVFIGLFRRIPNCGLLAAWTIIFPLGDAVTYYNAIGDSLRAAMGSVIWCLWAAIFVQQIWKLLAHTQVQRWMIAGVLIGALVVQTALFSSNYFGHYANSYGYAFETGYSQILPTLDRNGIEHVPITFVGGYERNYVAQYFSDYRLRIHQTLIACNDLPPNVVNFSVLPQVFVLREDRDYSAIPGCISHGLIGTDLAQLRSNPDDILRIVAEYPNAGTGPWRTAIVFVTSRHPSKDRRLRSPELSPAS